MNDLTNSLLTIDIDVADIRYDFEAVNWGLLIQLINKQGFPIAEIAKAAGVSRFAVYRWLDGSKPKNRTAGDKMIAMAFRWLPRDKREKCGAVPF